MSALRHVISNCRRVAAASFSEGHDGIMLVTCICTYRTTKAIEWSDRDFAAYKLIKTLKAKSISGWARVEVGPGEWVRFDDTNPQVALDVFGRLAASRFNWNGVGRAALVPIPNSACTTVADRLPRTLGLAEAVLRHVRDADLVAIDALRWTEATGPAHERCARRYPEQLFPLLRLVRQVPTDRPVVLVDDMLTTGGHMLAAEAFLRAAGVSVFAALCAGVSDDRPGLLDAFASRVIDLPRSISRPSTCMVAEWFGCGRDHPNAARLHSLGKDAQRVPRISNRPYTAPMAARIARITGAATTIVAGVLMAAVSLSALGTTATLFCFFAIFAVAAAAERGPSLVSDSRGVFTDGCTPSHSCLTQGCTRIASNS